MTKVPKLAAAFKVTHRPTGLFYVGCTTDIYKQLRYQATLLRTNKHKTPRLQEAFNQGNGFDDIGYTYATTGTAEDAERLAQRWLTEAGDDPLLVNLKKSKDAKNKNGVYVFTHVPTGHFYVGSSKDTHGRIATHKWALRNNQHKNVKLQSLYTGDIEQFQAEIVYTSNRETAYGMEQELITRHRENPLCLNIADDARSSISTVMKDLQMKQHSMERRLEALKRPETIAKRNESLKKRWSDPALKSTRQGGNNPFARKIVVHGIEYGSINDAIRQSEHSRGYIEKALRNPDVTDVYYLT